jgi:hypothetical protein
LYIGLNPVAARVAEAPETSDYTSIKQRLDHVEAEGKTAQLAATNGGSVASSQAAAGVEESLWLCPIEHCRGLDSTREGMIQGFPLGSYVKPTSGVVRFVDKVLSPESSIALNCHRSLALPQRGSAAAPQEHLMIN